MPLIFLILWVLMRCHALFSVSKLTVKYYRYCVFWLQFSFFYSSTWIISEQADQTQTLCDCWSHIGKWMGSIISGDVPIKPFWLLIAIQLFSFTFSFIFIYFFTTVIKLPSLLFKKQFKYEWQQTSCYLGVCAPGPVLIIHPYLTCFFSVHEECGQLCGTGD